MNTTMLATGIRPALNLTHNLNLNPWFAAPGIKIKRKIKIKKLATTAAMLTLSSWPVFAAEISLESAPPVVVKTVPVAGTSDVDPGLMEIRVTYSKAMQDGSWSWSTWGEENYPKTTGPAHYESDGRTCVLPVKLQPAKFYAIWLNSDKFKNFKDANGQPAVPYLLAFTTAGPPLSSENDAGRGFEHFVKPGDTLSQIVRTYREKGAVVTIEDVLKANPGLNPASLKVGQKIVIPAKPPSGTDKADAARNRKFVRVVLDDQRMTFEGESANWDRLESLLSAVPARSRTVLEWAVASTRTTLQQQNEWSSRFAELARKHGFEYSSYVGVQAFGSKGGRRPVEPTTADTPGAESTSSLLLNDDQRAVLAWTDRQFHSFFDARTFDGWSNEERAALEKKLIDALEGPRSAEYFQAINTLPALRSTQALPKLRAIAFERVDRNNRDRWMAIRALGILGDKESVPELIHLVYHGNVNTRWWAQIALVQITGKNFAKDWNAWGKWWNDQNGQPPYKPEIIRWWNGQPEPDKLAESLEESDRKFFESLKPKSAAAPTAPASTDVAARLRTAAPVMEGIRGAWSAAVEAINREDRTSALASLRTLAPRIQEFRDAMRGTSLEAGTAEALETLKPLISALEKGDLEAARSAMAPMMALGRKMEEQVKAVTEASPVPASEPVAGLANAVVLKRDNGIQKGVQSIAASGHAVEFERSGETRYEARYVEAVQFFGSRYGTPEAPQEDFHLYLLNDQQQVLAEVNFPYSMIERGDPKWYTLRTPSIEVPEKFHVALNFNPHQTKGVYLAYSAASDPKCHSLIGLPGEGFESSREPVEWMVRPCLTGEPTKAKGFQRLTDWKPPMAKDPFAKCRVASFGGDKSEGQQSYGGSGPAVRFKPAELVSGVSANETVILKGVRLYASRYGRGYSPEETKLHVILRDANDTALTETGFAYAKFGDKPGWVDLVFDRPVRIQKPGETVTIAFDPEATRFKGIYFHYQNNPPTSHSLVGTVNGGFKELPEREWMVRACFE